MEKLGRLENKENRVSENDCGNSSFSVAERLLLNKELPHDIASLVEKETTIPVNIDIDLNARLKITDACGMTCVFCHNEGTPVAVAYNGDLLQPNKDYQGGASICF